MSCSILCGFKRLLDGIKPPNNQNIFIARCTQMIIDCPLPSIRSLRIDGILEFQQVSYHSL